MRQQSEAFEVHPSLSGNYLGHNVYHSNLSQALRDQLIREDASHLMSQNLIPVHLDQAPNFYEYDGDLVKNDEMHDALLRQSGGHLPSFQH